MGTSGCPQEALAARQRQSRQAMPTAPGMPGAARQILVMAVKAQVTAAPVPCPLPVAREGGRAIVRCRAGSRVPPGTRSRASTGTRCAHQRRVWDGARPGQRGIWPASPGRRLMPRRTRPSLRARRQATLTLIRRAHPRRRQTARAARRATASARRPGHRARGHARVGPVSGKDCRRPGTDPGRGWTARRRCPGLSTASRLIGPKDRSFPRAAVGAVAARVLTHADEGCR